MNGYFRSNARRCHCLFAALVLWLGPGAATRAQEPAPPEQPASPAGTAEGAKQGSVPESWIAQLRWRSIGPAAMGGRITALAVYEKDPSTWWAATASGGLLKTVNNGVSFEHQFDREATVSIGDVSVFQGDPNIVWVGGGESNPRNSSSWGDGVYKSVDGGKTWKNMGLREIFQTGRVLIHPEDPNIVYVGAMGRLWGENEARGVFKTTDGGANWEKILYVDTRTGCIDLEFQPGNPDVLLAAMWERLRDGFDTNTPKVPWGPGSGLYKSADAGKTWSKLSDGLPKESHIGRIGIQFYPKEPNVVYVVLESERSGLEPENAGYLGIRGEDADVGARLTEVTKDSPAETAGLKVGDIVISVDGTTVHSYGELLREIRKRIEGEKLEFSVSRERKSVTVEATLAKKPNASSQPVRGRPNESLSDNRPFGTMLGGQAANIHDQQGRQGNEYGGVYRSDNAGDTWTRINSVNPRPMYFSEVRVDPSDNNYLWVLGVDLHRSKDGGATFTDDGARGVHSDHHAMWIDPRDGRHAILGTDGGIYVTYDRGEAWDHLNHAAIGQFYHVAVDNRPNYNVYGGLQDNGSWGGPSRVRHGRGPVNFDWFRVGGGDGFVCRVDVEDPDQVYYTSQNGGLGRLNLRTGERGGIRPERGGGGVRYRWNWETPFILSHHNSRIFYTAGNYVFRSLNRGRDLKRISPEITFTRLGTGTDISESPVDSDVLYVGSDDGALHGTRDGGRTWKLLNKFPAEKMPKVEAPEDSDEAASGESASTAASQPGPGTDAPAEADRPRRRPPGADSAGESGEGNRRGGGPGRMLERLKELDANSDGKIQRGEVPERMQRLFDRGDANQDGEIDSAEMESMRERMRQFGPGGRPPRDEPPAAPDSPAEAVPVTGEPPTAEAPAAAEPAAEGAPAEQAAGERPAPPAEPAAVAVVPAGEAASPPAESASSAAPSSAPVEVAATSAAPADDPLSGDWTGKLSMEGMPPDAGRFTLTLALAADGQVTGHLASMMSEGEIAEGKFDRAANRLTFSYSSEMGTADFTATLAGKRLTGTLEGDGGFSMAFEADLTGPAASATKPKEALAEQIAAVAQKAAGGGRPLAELLPGPRWISSVEASRFKAGRVYVAIDGHRSNDDEPYLFVSEDFGETWRSIRGNMPTSAGSTRCLREDIVNENLLYAGTEFGAWVSIDRGQSWTRLNSNLPTVAVHDFAIHPTAGEVVVATHGRSLWALDVTPLRQMSPGMVKQEVALLKPGSATYWRPEPSRGSGTREFVGNNDEGGVEIMYLLQGPAEGLTLKITDLSGEVMRTLEAPGDAGLNRVEWNLRRDPPPGGGPGRGPAGRGGGPGRFRRFGGALAPSGTYIAALSVGGTTYSQRFDVNIDPQFPDYRPWEMTEAQLSEIAGELDESGGQSEAAAAPAPGVR